MLPLPAVMGANIQIFFIWPIARGAFYSLFEVFRYKNNIRRGSDEISAGFSVCLIGFCISLGRF